MPPRRSAESQSARENDVPTNAELAQAQFQREFAGKGKRKNEEEHQQGEKRPKFPHPGQNRNYQGKGGPRNHNGHQVQRNQRAERHYNCKRCNKDHLGVDCQGNVVKCFNCNKMGHRAFECYANKNGNPSWQNQNKTGGNNGKNLGGGNQNNQNNQNGNRNGGNNAQNNNGRNGGQGRNELIALVK
nr:putative mediator of RNA polymerase II transcription subunit 24 [Ipomoea batatas]